MAKKIPKPTKKAVETYKVIDNYKDIRTWKMKTATSAFYNDLARNLVLWSLQESAIHFSQFCAIQGISMKTFETWIERYPEVREAYDTARDFIAGRREVGAIFSEIDGRKVNGNEITKYQTMYCRHYRDDVKWRSTLATPDKLIAGKQVVIIDRISPDEPIILEPSDD